MARELATIRKVGGVLPIEGADRIVAYMIDGWQVVDQKDAYNTGDLVVYFEIDSWIPNEVAPFLSKDKEPKEYNGIKGERLKTIKLKKTLSQGLIMPLNKFPQITDVKEGLDVTEILGIEKWEAPEEISSNGSSSKKESEFPSFIRKTDQQRIQNFGSQVFASKNEVTYERTIKLDGSSMTVYYVDQNSNYFNQAMMTKKKNRDAKKQKLFKSLWQKIVGFFNPEPKPEFISAVCSRNIQLKDDDGSHFWEYVKQHEVLEKITAYCKEHQLSYAVQGELIAPNIQKNYEQVKEPAFYVFDVFDIDRQEYLLPSTRRKFIEAIGLTHVPVLDEEYKIGEYEDTRAMTDAILEMAEGPSINNPKREGIVYKANNSDFSFKSISNSYLLQKDKK